MATTKGTRKTTYPRTAEGHDLPATLTSSMVGPVQSSTADPAIAEAVEAAADLIVDELHTLSSRTNITAIMAVIVSVLQQLYEPLVVATLKQQVFECLLKRGHFRRASNAHKNIVYDVFPPKKAPLTKDEALAKLVRRLEELTEENRDLRCQLADAKESTADSGLIERLVSELETARARVQTLETQVTEARQSAASADRKHAREIGVIRTQLTEARQTIERLEGELTSQQEKSSTLNGDLTRRLKNLGL